MDSMNDLFIQERQGVPPAPNPFRPYAERYHELCDRFDAHLDPRQHGARINRHARQVREMLSREAYGLGLADSIASAENLLRVAISGAYQRGKAYTNQS